MDRPSHAKSFGILLKIYFLNPPGFLRATAAILMWDVVYGLAVEKTLNRVSPNRKKKGHLGIWAGLNLVFGISLTLGLITLGAEISRLFLIIVCISLAIRTLADYLLLPGLYFPDCRECQKDTSH